MEPIRPYLSLVQERIRHAAERAGRAPQAVTLVAITKTVGIPEISALISEGVRDCGENRVQDAIPKINALESNGMRWHFVGNIQTNKIKKIVEHFSVIHSVNRLDLLAPIQYQAKAQDKPIDILIEVNVSGEFSKQGMPPELLDASITACRSLSHLRLRGLMTMAPWSDHPEASRPVFKELKRLADHYALPELSMGMSNDYEIAVEEGATLVRIGRALFG